MKKTHQRMIFTCMSTIPIFFLLFSGCSLLDVKTGGTKQSSTSESQKGPVPRYYDFGDILIPGQIKPDIKTSFVFRTEGMTAGILRFKGRVEAASVIKFFENNMAKDNWQEVGSFKSRRTIMLFSKESRRCVINITEDYNTLIEIWVIPTTSEHPAGKENNEF
jgi:hypothetical protein